MTDQRTLKKIINEQRDEIKSLQATYQALYDLHQKVTDTLKKIQEVVNGELNAWMEAYSIEAHPLQGEAIESIKRIIEVLDYQQEKVRKEEYDVVMAKNMDMCKCGHIRMFHSVSDDGRESTWCCKCECKKFTLDKQHPIKENK